MSGQTSRGRLISQRDERTFCRGDSPWTGVQVWMESFIFDLFKTAVGKTVSPQATFRSVFQSYHAGPWKSRKKKNTQWDTGITGKQSGAESLLPPSVSTPLPLILPFLSLLFAPCFPFPFFSLQAPSRCYRGNHISALIQRRENCIAHTHTRTNTHTVTAFSFAGVIEALNPSVSFLSFFFFVV